MPEKLRLLIVEDNPSDAELMLHALRRAGFDPVGDRVETEEDYRDRLEARPDLILADFSLPQMAALRAFEIMQEQQLDIPFIIVSGTIGEELAVEVMHRGVADYVMKDRLARLGPAVHQGLTRKRFKEEKLKAERMAARLAAIVETSGDAIIAKTLDGTITSWNRGAENLYGYSAEEMLRRNISQIFPRGRRQSDAPEDMRDIFKRLARGENITAFETVRVRKDGRRIEVLLSISPIREPNGTVIGASAIAHDISQRKRSERFLTAEQSVARILMESKSLEEAGPRVLQIVAETLRWEVALLWMIDREANVLRRAHFWHCSWAGQNFVKALDQKIVLEPGVGVAGRTWSSGEPVWESGIFVESQPYGSSALTSEGLRGAFGLPMRQGTQMVGVIEFYHPELREPDQLLLASLDNIASQISQFSERCRTEDALRASEEQFRQLANALPQIVWTAGPDGKATYFNERWIHFAGCGRDQDPDATWSSLIYPDDLQRSLDLWAVSIQTGAPFEVEIRLVDGATGLPRWFLFRAIASRDAMGRITRWTGTGTDIDNQQRNLEELRVSEQRFRTLVMALPAAVYTTDRTGLITLSNERAVELWGQRPELGKDRWCGAWKLLRRDGSLVPPEQSPMAVTLRDGMAAAREELIIERPDGTRASVLQHAEPLRGAGGEIVGAVNIVVDLTQLRQLEDRLRQSQKMEAVGQLAAGVAHDFNNLLTIIMGYSELCLISLPAGGSSRDSLEVIFKAAERATILTRQLLAFGRKQILAPVVLDLNSLLTETKKMVARLIGADIELINNLQTGLGSVKVDPGQIEQIILNLVVNARDAMPEGGCITIQTANTVLSDAQQQQNADAPPGDYTLLSVSDTGTGMDAATKAHIFEPFFTTKEVGKGTGLGLATVFGIVKQSGGFIEVDTEPGVGSTFRIYLPQCADGRQSKKVDAFVVKMPRGTETILLVEDEDGLRELAQIVLESNGYKVLCASNGSDALGVDHAHAEEIQLLLTDVVMPKMGGRQLADVLKKTRPKTKVLFMSGYTDDTIVRNGVKDVGSHFLCKPFNSITLARKVRDVLDEVGDPNEAEPLPLEVHAK